MEARACYSDGFRACNFSERIGDIGMGRYDPYVENRKFDEARRRREDERDELL